MSIGKSKGIYCIEGIWDHTNLKNRKSVRPMLEFLEESGICKYIYHGAATGQEVEYLLDRWTRKTVCEKYPGLYLATHGTTGTVMMSPGHEITIEDLGDFLAGNCSGKVVYFGGCSTMDIHGTKIQTFLSKTGAIAAIGYKSDTDWVRPMACDLFVFDAIQKDNLDSRGIKKIEKSTKTEYGNLWQKLDLRFVINGSAHFPRRRKPNSRSK